MKKPILYPSEVGTQSLGRLRVNVNSILQNRPIVGASVSISYTGDPSSVVEQAQTDQSGQTNVIELSTPPLDYSLQPGPNQPYAEYTITISAPGFESLEVNGAQILPDVTAIQNASLLPLKDAVGNAEEVYVIDPHTLFGNYPPKIAESEIKPTSETGEIVLSEVVIPEFIVVHNGPPKDTGAQDYYVKYKDYIKNVASSEIYATWPESTIQANVLAIQSFTLNRVYTEWYRNKGFNFTITSSTAYDHKFIPERNIYENISQIVDTIFTNYLSRPNVKQPILTQYCDGRQVTCPRWMTQWGSKDLGDAGYSAIEILRNFYGDNMFINTAKEVSGIPVSWPGTLLEIGSRNNNVRTIQNQLNVISRAYPLIPKLAEYGIYGEKTAEAVSVFQKIFDLPESGIVDFATWYRISEIFVAVSRIAELA